MKNQAQAIPFNFNSNAVRVINQDGNAWFVASDVSDALGYRDASNMVRVLDDDESDTHTVSIRSENGVEQGRDVLIINESGLYHALFKSRKKEAVVFRKWVTSEVLPSIRKTGTYSIQQTQLATAAQKQHLKSLVSDRVSKTGLHFQKVWTAVQEANGFNRLDNLTPQSYAKACAYFKADPIGLNPDDWAHAPAALPQPQPATFIVPDGMMLVSRKMAINLWTMARQLTNGIDALGMMENDIPKHLMA